MSAPLTRLFLREVAAAWAAGSGPASPAAFLIGAAALLAFAVGADGGVLIAAGPGLLTAAYAIVGVLSLEALFRDDLETGAAEVLAQGPAPLEAFAAIRILARTVAVLAPAALAAPAAAVMLGLSGPAALASAPILALAGLGLTAAGAPGAALAAGRARAGLLIAVLTPPLTAPTVIFAAAALQAVQEGRAPGGELALLTAAGLFALVVGAFGAGAALRMHLE